MQQRRSIRLKTWDYRQAAAYFVTLVTAERLPFFGKVRDGQVSLSEYGRIAQAQMRWLPGFRPTTRLDAWVIMPNHIHFIIWMTNGTAGQGPPAEKRRVPVAGSLGSLIGAYKSAVSRRINNQRGTPGASVWQRNYYEHIVRDEDELGTIREYIRDNPANWDEDKENPDYLR